MPTAEQFARYIATPYKHHGRDLRGWDCYGLYRYVLWEQFGIAIGSYADEYPGRDGSDATDIAITRALRLHAGDGNWQRVAPGSEFEGCGIVFNIAGQPLHCGYVLEPGKMLHALKGRGTTIERYDSPAWTKRIEGLYKWNSLSART